MKRLMLNVLVVVLFLTGLLILGESATLAGQFAGHRITYLSDDPNDPNVPSDEGVIANQISRFSDDPNVPSDEIAMGSRIVHLEADANTPSDESCIY